jgi:hypothetical protein
VKTKSLTPEQMEARVARFNKLQTYQRQNFETHNILPGAMEKVAARRRLPGYGSGRLPGSQHRRAG